MQLIRLKRIYEQPTSQDGVRILVDSLWPQGLHKDDAMIDLWLKEIAPTDNLRKWFSHDPEKWEEFKQKYNDELNQYTGYVQRLLDIAKENDITLLYSAKDKKFNNAVVLKEHLQKQLNQQG